MPNRRPGSNPGFGTRFVGPPASVGFSIFLPGVVSPDRERALYVMPGQLWPKCYDCPNNTWTVSLRTQALTWGIICAGVKQCPDAARGVMRRVQRTSGRLALKKIQGNTVMQRRDFFKYAGAGLAFSTGLLAADSVKATSRLAVCRNGSPADLVRKAVDALGGMSKFVQKGQTVLLKPNIGWDRSPQQAANTHPEAVAQVVKMCLDAGAQRVRVLDRTCHEPRRCYEHSGIEKAATAAGAQVRHIVDSRFQEVAIPQGELLKSCQLYQEVLDADVFINMPIAKDHAISRVTLGFKNIMGLLGGDRGNLHNKFMTKIVDVNAAVKPTLTIIDAWRVLLHNGPSGGNLADVVEKQTVIASTDRVAADAFGMTLFDIDPMQVEFLRLAYKRGMGELDLKLVHILEVNG